MKNYLEELITKAREQHIEEVDVLKVFYNSYEIHKKRFGTFRDFQGEEYHKKMDSRYKFMYETALEYIKGVLSDRQKLKSNKTNNDRYADKQRDKIVEGAGMTFCGMDGIDL